MKFAFIYAIKNLNTGQYYVGSTRDLKTRWDQHLKNLESKTHTEKLQKAWDESNPEDWEWLILEDQIPIIHQFESEQYWIDSLNSFDDGYNSNPRAGSYVSIDDRGYEGIVEERESDILEMLEKIGEEVPYRSIAEEYGVSLGFLNKLKTRYIDLFPQLVAKKEDQVERAKSREINDKSRVAWQQMRNKLILEMVEEGITYREISKELGCSLGIITKVVKSSADQ